jgi:uncharacterized membrane protein YvbJ
MKTCLHCGKQLRDDTVKCFFCGEMADELPQSKQNGPGGWEKNKDIVVLIIILIICIALYLIKK